MKAAGRTTASQVLHVLVLALPIGLAACASQYAQTKVQRQPMEKPAVPEYKIPEHYEPRLIRYDAKTGKPISYDHKPRFEVVDAKAGRYAFKWVGFDGLEKTATFNRVDAVDVLVSASVVKLLPDRYQYTYEVKNLPSSGTHLNAFIIQTFSVEVKQAYGGQFWGGPMSKSIKAYSHGTWIDFADVSDHVQINPGQFVTIQFTSPDPPGLVECRAGAESEVESTSDEDVPGDMTFAVGGYGEYLHGWTIGPVDKLKRFSAAERASYLLDRFAQFRKLGWITDDAAARYERQLKSNNLDNLIGALDQDLKSEQITTEVAALIMALK